MEAPPTNEIEVYRLDLEKGKYYETTTCTRIEGNWFTAKYYTTNPMRYVGEFVEHYRLGWNGGIKAHGGIFINNGKEERIFYRYDNKTCFREVLPRGLPNIVKEDLLKKYEEISMKPLSLETMARYALSSLDLKDAKTFNS
uniref:Uncharacterized protein n=1 Tax=viral metagenome TaxID=1070528 RepID=A0A6C0DRG9_9ZZZZ